MPQNDHVSLSGFLSRRHSPYFSRGQEFLAVVGKYISGNNFQKPMRTQSLKFQPRALMNPKSHLSGRAAHRLKRGPPASSVLNRRIREPPLLPFARHAIKSLVPTVVNQPQPSAMLLQAGIQDFD